MCVHREVLQVHGALGMNGQPEGDGERLRTIGDETRFNVRQERFVKGKMKM